MHFEIHEPDRFLIMSERKGGWMPREQTINIPYQSELTQLVVQQLLESGNCDLTSLDDAFRLHQPLLNAFMQHLMNISENEYVRCPIT